MSQRKPTRHPVSLPGTWCSRCLVWCCMVGRQGTAEEILSCAPADRQPTAVRPRCEGSWRLDFFFSRPLALSRAMDMRPDAAPLPMHADTVRTAPDDTSVVTDDASSPVPTYPNESVCMALNLLGSCGPVRNRKRSIIARRLLSSAGCSEQRRGRASELARMRQKHRCRSG